MEGLVRLRHPEAVSATVPIVRSDIQNILSSLGDVVNQVPCSHSYVFGFPYLSRNFGVIAFSPLSFHAKMV